MRYIFTGNNAIMVIGREVEQRQLLQALEAEESQFIAVYGRRRIGKTYLIRQTLQKIYKTKFLYCKTNHKRRRLSIL
jgi:AAA+ ATPase superfamily predicted ATPase